MTLTLTDEIDISRGDVLSGTEDLAGVADQFETTLVWMAEEPMLPGRPYLLKIGAKTVIATVSALKHKVNVNTLEHTAAKALGLNEIGIGNISLDQPIAFDAYADNRETGGYILIDRISNETVGAGLLHFALPALAERALAGARHRQGGACPAQGAKALCAMVYRPIRCRQVDHRQISSRRSSMPPGGIPRCSTATMSATG